MTATLVRTVGSTLCVTGACVVVAAGAFAQAGSKRNFAVAAYNYGYSVDGQGATIRVDQYDLVRITLSTMDIPHNFTIEDETYRIMRRAAPGKPVTFEFRADKPGGFPFRCTLAADDHCRTMAGLLIVTPRASADR